MAQASDLQHHVYSTTSLPYVTNSSPLSADPQYIDGSHDALTSVKGFAELRPGFDTSLETVARSFHNLQNMKVWRKWGSTYYAMFSNLNASGFAEVYKYAIGVDATSVLLFTSTSGNQFDFAISNNTCYFGNDTEMGKFLASSTSDTSVYHWGIVAPVQAPTFTLGGTGIDGAAGYYYGYTYFNLVTGHESDMSPLSICTGTFTNQTVSLTGFGGNDGGSGYTNQLGAINWYRTTDGGSTDPTTMHLLAQVALPALTYNDSTPDASLGTEVAPQTNYNDPPPVGFGFVWSQGRIWYFTDATTWFTGYEEIAKGVPEECVPGGTLGINGGGNDYNWANEVTGHAALPDGICVSNSTSLWKIEGDSLDTFRRYQLLEKRGTSNRNCITSLGSSVVWFDTAGQMWSSDLGEVGLPIRPDLSAINQANAYVAIHISGNQHWLCVLDGDNGVLFVFDLDQQRWMPLWDVGATASALNSSEISTGTIRLLLARNQSKVLYQGTSYVDDGNAYSSSLKTGMMWIADSSSFLEKYDRSNPEWRGLVDNVELKTNTVLATLVSQLNDDDPTLAPYTAIAATSDSNLDVPQGTYIKLTRYPSAPTTKVGRMTSINTEWSAGTGAWKLYQWDIAYRLFGS